MITVYVWEARGGNVGHASARIEQATGPDGYVSWWPGGGNWKKRLPGAANSYAGDTASEGGSADHICRVTGLNEARGLEWWRDFRASRSDYQASSQNCAWAVVTMLKAAGGDAHITWTGFLAKYNIPWHIMVSGDFFDKLLSALVPDKNNAEDVVRFFDDHTSVWTPNDALRYAQAVAAGLSR